jgi:hypothetical protein
MALRIGSAPQGMTPLTPPDNTIISRSLLDVRHPDWQVNNEAWVKCALMYEGEPVISKNADKFLSMRPQEDPGVYQHRLSLFIHNNHLGTGMGYYEAQMFNENPDITIQQQSKTGGTDIQSKLSPEQQAFYEQRYLKNCDRAGTPLIDKFQKVYQFMLEFGAAWVLTDLPQPEDAPISLQDQKAKNQLDPYNVLFEPIDVINWKRDDKGDLEWAVIFTSTFEQEFLKTPEMVDRWYFYDRQTYRIYEQHYEAPTSKGVVTAPDENKAPCKLVATGYHCMAKLNQLPLVEYKLPLNWWLAKCAYSPAIGLINTDNVRRWSMHMAALAVPVVFTEENLSSLKISEYGFIKLKPGDKYEFSEPEGRSWVELGKESISLKENIFRSMYLVSMARDTNATAAAQSGVSKAQDMAPSHVVLSGMGAVLRQAMQDCINRVRLVRSLLPGSEEDANLAIDVRGFQFEDKISVEEIEIVATLLEMEIPSDSFEKEMFKATIGAFLKNCNPDTIAKMYSEIDSAPTREQRDQAKIDMQLQTVRKRITAANTDPVAKSEIN